MEKDKWERGTLTLEAEGHEVIFDVYVPVEITDRVTAKGLTDLLKDMLVERFDRVAKQRQQQEQNFDVPLTTEEIFDTAFVDFYYISGNNKFSEQ